MATTEYLLNKEVEHVLAALTKQNQLIARVCLHTGLRIGDVLNLRTEQLGLQFWVTEAKTKKRRRVGLPQPLIDEIKKQAGQIWAFPGRYGDKPKTRQAVWRDIKRAAKAFRFPQNVSVHSLRKVYAVDLMHKYGDIERVRKVLNHSNTGITSIYAMADKILQDKLSSRS